MTWAEEKCWVYPTLDKDGYGRIHWREDGVRHTTTAHRYFYEEFVGPVPEGMQLDHLCRNRGCCNPDHLEPVTGKENRRRGEGRGGVLAPEQTHCVQGHELTPDNRAVRTDSKRGWCCRLCRNAVVRQRRRRRREGH